MQNGERMSLPFVPPLSYGFSNHTMVCSGISCERVTIWLLPREEEVGVVGHHYRYVLQDMSIHEYMAGHVLQMFIMMSIDGLPLPNCLGSRLVLQGRSVHRYTF